MSKPRPPRDAWITPRQKRRGILAVILVGLGVSVSNTFGLTDVIESKVTGTVDSVKDSVSTHVPTARPTSSRSN